MARLPQPGSDSGTWGDILNDYLTQTLNSDGTLKSGIVTDTNVSASAAIAQSKIANLTSDLAGKAASSHTHTAANISDSTTTGRSVLTAASAAAARSAIGVESIGFNVKDYGATGDGTTDDRAAIQSAINAAQSATGYGTVYLPDGTYKINASLSVSEGIRITGSYASSIVSNNSAVFNFGGNYMHPGYNGQAGIIEVDHLILDATGGHVFDQPNINQGYFHDLILYQRSSNKSVWNQPTGNLLVTRFEKVISTVYGATRSVPSWVIKGSTTADVANVTWDDCLWQNPDQDATQFQVFLTATGASSARRYTEQMRFTNCYFEMPFGGAVKSLSGQGVMLDNCRVYDVFSKSVGNSMFYFGQDPNSTWPSTNTTIIGTGRDLQGPNGSSTYDVELESTSQQTTIINYDVRDIPGVFTGHPYFNLGNSSAVTLINNRSETLTNAGGTGLWDFPSDGTLSGAMSSPLVVPADMSYKAWNYDPAMVSGSTAPTGGTVWLLKVILRQPQSIGSIHLYVNTGGTSLTSSQNWAGLYNSSGTLLDSTADQTSAWGSSGLKSMNLSGGAQTRAAGNYFVAFVSNGSTPPQFGRTGSLNGTLYNGNVSASTYRFATNSTGQTTLPSSLTLSSNTAGNVAFWCALG